MPSRTRRDRRAEQADFPITPELIEAFRAYVASEPVSPTSLWPENCRLGDLLEEAGAPVEPLLNICCWHPKEPAAGPLSIYRRLAAAQ